MPRAKGNDLAEIFGYAPDDTSEAARRQWKSQKCPFVDGICIKHSHATGGFSQVYGTCSVHNKSKRTDEEIITCAQRLYSDNYSTLKAVTRDALGVTLPHLTMNDYAAHKNAGTLPVDFIVMIGRGSGKEVALSKPDVIDLSLDWIFARVSSDELLSVIPCEVQSMDTTGNYCANWEAYRDELPEIPDSQHGINWANVWKRLIPQLILKGAVASTSNLCQYGHYFILPERVYLQFEKIVGRVPSVREAGRGVMSVMTYSLGSQVQFGSIRQLEYRRSARAETAQFAQAFGSGQQVLQLGPILDDKIHRVLGLG